MRWLATLFCVCVGAGVASADDQETTRRCDWPAYAEPSLLVGAAFADHEINQVYAPAHVIGRLAAGLRYRRCREARRLYQAKLGGVIETGGGDAGVGYDLEASYGGELTLSMSIAHDWQIGPRVALMFPDNAVAVWLGARAETRFLFVGLDVVRVTAPGENRDRASTGVYATIGATGKPGAIAAAVELGAALLLVGALHLFCCGSQ